MPQMQLPIFPEGVTDITALLAFSKQDGRVTYFNGSMPVFVHDEEDRASFQMITAQFCVNGNAKQADIVRALFITSGAFAGMSLLGYTTKKDLAPVGRFLAMATFGILIALLVNIFLIQSSGFELLLSIVVVLVFSGLTAYETQQIK